MKQNGLTPTVGHLDPASPEAQWWHTVCGNLEVPLKSMIPYVGGGAGVEPQEYYDVDVSRLTPEQFEAICKIMAAKFDVPLEEVRKGMLGDHGLPVRADRLTSVSFDARLFL